MQPTLTAFSDTTTRKGLENGYSYAKRADYLCSAGCTAVELASVTTTTAQQIYCNGNVKSKYYAINLF